MLNNIEKECSICGNTSSIYRYFKNKYDEDELICEECLLELDGITDEITRHYFLDGEYIGNNDEIEELFENICYYKNYEEVEDD